MTAETRLLLIREVLSEQQVAELLRDGEMNMSFAVPGVGNYRVNAMR